MKKSRLLGAVRVTLLSLVMLLVTDLAKAVTLIYFHDGGGIGNIRGLYNFDTETNTTVLRTTILDTDYISAMDARLSDNSIFGVNFDGDLFSVNVNTGQLTTIGNTGISTTLTGLAIHPESDQFFGLTNNGELYSINSATAQASYIGSTQFPQSVSCPGFQQVVRGISFSPEGALFGFDIRTGLFGLDTLTGAPTFIGRTSCNYVSEDSTFTKDGELYLVDFNGILFKINPVTGERTLVEAIDQGWGVWGLVAEPSIIPIPPALWLFGSGLLGLVGIARRRKVVKPSKASKPSGPARPMPADQPSSGQRPAG